MGKEIVFYYDVICPYAYLASKLIKDVCKRNNVRLLWRPVLLGGIYKKTKAEGADVPDNKMILTYADQKRRMLAQDLAMMYMRYQIPISRLKVPDIRTLNAMRLIASTPDESSEVRESLTHALYDTLWLHKQDVSDPSVLQDVVNKVNYKINVEEFINDKTHPAREKLIENTEEAVKRGAFGVPSIWVNNRLYFGGDRFFMVERELENMNASPHRLLNKPISDRKTANLTVYFDFASPWTHIAIKQISGLLSSLKPLNVNVTYIPVPIGVIFKQIGTPMIPAQAMGTNKRNYQFQDMKDWLSYKNINNFQFSSHFPLNTLTALRVAVANPKLKMIEQIFDATWSENLDISDQQVLSTILLSNGYDAQSLLQKAQSDEIRQQLRNNTKKALDNGVCGLPSFQVNDGPIVFGQDRLNVVADMLLGWDSGLDFRQSNSKL